MTEPRDAELLRLRRHHIFKEVAQIHVMQALATGLIQIEGILHLVTCVFRDMPIGDEKSDISVVPGVLSDLDPWCESL